MTIKVITWRPDTCDCAVRQQYDDAADPITISFHSVINKCSQHASLTNDVDVYNCVTDENPRRNRAKQTLLDNAPTSFYDVIDANGNRQFKSGISLNWSYSGTVPNRLLTISVNGISLSQNQINAIQTKLSEKFGINSVVIVSA